MGQRAGGRGQGPGATEQGAGGGGQGQRQGETLTLKDTGILGIKHKIRTDFNKHLKSQP